MSVKFLLMFEGCERYDLVAITCYACAIATLIFEK